MRRLARAAAVAALVGLIVLLVVLAMTPTPTDPALDIYLLYLGGVALLTLVAATSHAAGVVESSEFEAALAREPPIPERPRQLVRLEREVYLAEQSVLYLHNRLRATLRGIAAHRLRTRRGIDLDGRPEAARALLGENAWALLRPDREPPRNRDARGLPVAELRVIVDALEKI